MQAQFDHKKFDEFINNYSKFEQQFNTWIKNFMWSEGMRFLAKVKPITPVDTGDLRNAWQITDVVRKGHEVICYFTNSKNYATFVEYGHAKPYKSGASPGSVDWVNGFFMMTISLSHIQRTMPKRFDAEFTKWLDKLK